MPECECLALGDANECYAEIGQWYEATKGIPVPGAGMAFRPDSEGEDVPARRCRHGTDETQHHRNEISRHKETVSGASCSPSACVDRLLFLPVPTSTDAAWLLVSLLERSIPQWS